MTLVARPALRVRLRSVSLSRNGKRVLRSVNWEIRPGQRWALIGGVAAAGLAASAGFMDYLAVGTTVPRAVRTASTHLTVMLSVTSIAAIDLVYRGAEAPTGTGRVLHVAALVLVAAGLCVGGWLGGHLVFHYGVGVDPRQEERKT